MAVLSLPTDARRKPQFARLNRRSSLLRDLCFYVPVVERGGSPYDLAGKSAGTLTAIGTGNAPTWESSERGAVLRFEHDGDNDGSAVNFGRETRHTPDIITVSVWVRYATDHNTGRFVIGGVYDNSTNERSWYLGQSGATDDDLDFGISANGTGWDIASWASVITHDNLWHHLLATWDGSENGHKIYIDGADIGAGAHNVNSGPHTGALHPGDTDFWIGAVTKTSNDESPWEGDIENFGVWGRVLSDAEKLSLYREPYSLISPVRLFATETVGGGDTALTVQGLSIAATLGESALSVAAQVAPEGLSVAPSLAELALNVGAVLEVDALNTGVTVGELALEVSGTITLGVDDITVAVSILEINLAAEATLAIDSLNIATAIDDPALSLDVHLIAEGLAVSVAVPVVDLLSESTLAVDDLTTSVTLANVDLGSLGNGWAKMNDEILSYFNTNFPAKQPTVEIAWPNIKFEPNPNEAFVRITNLFGVTSNTAIGGSRKRRAGVIVVQVFTPLNTPSEDNLLIVDDVIAVLGGATISNLRLQPGEVIPIGENEQHYQNNVQFSFTSDKNT